MPEVYTCLCDYQTWLIMGRIIECSNGACCRQYQLPESYALPPSDFNHRREVLMTRDADGDPGEGGRVS